MHQQDTYSISPGVQLALASADEARIQANGIIKSHVIASMSVAMLPLPMFDIVALTNVQLDLVGRLADHYGVPFTLLYPSLVSSLAGGSIPVLLLAAGGSLSKLVPGFGSLAGGLVLSNLAAASTYALGRVYMEHFDSGGTLQDIRLKAVTAQFRRELSNGRKMARELRSYVAT